MSRLIGRRWRPSCMDSKQINALADERIRQAALRQLEEIGHLLDAHNARLTPLADLARDEIEGRVARRMLPDPPN